LAPDLRRYLKQQWRSLQVRVRCKPEAWQPLAGGQRSATAGIGRAITPASRRDASRSGRNGGHRQRPLSPPPASFQDAVFQRFDTPVVSLRDHRLMD